MYWGRDDSKHRTETRESLSGKGSWLWPTSTRLCYSAWGDNPDGKAHKSNWNPTTQPKWVIKKKLKVLEINQQMASDKIEMVGEREREDPKLQEGERKTVEQK